MEKYKGGFQSIRFPLNFIKLGEFVTRESKTLLIISCMGKWILTLIPFCASLEFTCQGSVDELVTIVDVAFIIHWAILCPTEFVRRINLNSTLSKFHRRVLCLSKYTNLRLRPSDIYSYDAYDLSFFSIHDVNGGQIVFCIVWYLTPECALL